MHLLHVFSFSVLAALCSAYKPPSDLEDGIYMVDPTAQIAQSAKFASNFDNDGLIRVGDLTQHTGFNHTTQFSRRDDFTQHPRETKCETYDTMLLADYTVAMNSFADRCTKEKVPARKKNGLICSGKQGILFVKAGGSIVYHCNVSCQKQNCGGGHIAPFEDWADQICGSLKGAWFYSSWDFTMGRDEWGSEFCRQTI
ncbi:hypothetical protein F4678DRAFT_480318 [Xylaria arbuscula]|nr:hypothetical protein F4678DRAFT_480318 [Xylaria arbuscula]